MENDGDDRGDDNILGSGRDTARVFGAVRMSGRIIVFFRRTSKAVFKLNDISFDKER